METLDTPTVIAPVNTPVANPIKDEEPKLPPMYAVILHNDPSTPYFFVISVLIEVFGLEPEQAAQLMWSCHRSNRALVRVYSKEVAETKVEQAQTMILSKGMNGMDPNAPCELTFTAEPETEGDK